MRRIFKNWWIISISVSMVLLVLIAWALPLFVGFMRPLWVRITGSLIVVATWALLAFLRVRKARKASRAIAEGLAAPSAADEESKLLATRMREALTSLKTASGKKRDYLYSRPWYVIIGPPGSGKTTALLNSGLRFPYSQQAIKGIGGTRNLDFWFADEAVMIDTAGRYTTQDSNYEVDSRGWTSFLSLLKKHRPLQPINGIIVAIPTDELIRSDCAGIDAHAAAVRRRLAELRSSVEVQAPIYVMLTKADLLAGFTEYFDDLDVDGRRAVLGRTLPFAPGKPAAETLVTAFDEMSKALAERQAKRLFEEVDQGRRALLLGFPAQVQSLRARFMRFLEGAFVAGEQPGGVLRGFYLTSGVQEGAPLDRILASVAEVYDRPNQVRPGQTGRAYFLNRLLTEVMFNEAGLVQMEPKARARQKARLTAALACIGLLAVLTIAAWSVSFVRNRDFQSELGAAAIAARETVRGTGISLTQVRANDPDLRAALPLLNALRDLPHGYAARREDWTPISMRFGLFQSSLSRQAEESYLEALRRIMLPRLLLRLETYLRVHRGDAMSLYEPLKAYMMLGGLAPVPLDQHRVGNWVTRDWATEVYPNSDSELERRQLAAHLTALLGDTDMASAWSERRAPLDGALISDVQAQLTILDAADRAYALMRQNALSAGEPWRMARILSAGDARAFADPEAVLRIEVPYFFTRQGYERNYLVRLATIQSDLEQDLWVLGPNANTAGIHGEMTNLRAGIAGRYATEYNAAWDRAIAGLRPGDYFRDAGALAAFTKSPSPLKLVLLEVRRNTSFEGGTRAALGRAVQQRLTRSRAGQFVNDMNQGQAAAVDAGAEIASHFAELHEYVGDGGSAPIDEFVNAVKQAGTAVIAARTNPGAGGFDALQTAMANANASVGTAAAGAPSQLRGFASAAAQSGSTAQTSAATGAIAAVYAQTVLPDCRAATEHRYPFDRGQQDADMMNVQRVFGPTGIVHDFVQQRLTPLLDTAGPVWRWRSDASVTASFNPATPEEFSKAAQISALLTAGLSLRVRVERFGSGTGRVVLYSGGGTEQSFDRNAMGPKPIVWQVQGSPEAYLILQPGETGGAPPVQYRAEGPWALFRLLDQATAHSNVGERSVRATFGQGAQAAILLIDLPSEKTSFSGSGFWLFRCPTAL